MRETQSTKLKRQLSFTRQLKLISKFTTPSLKTSSSTSRSSLTRAKMEPRVPQVKIPRKLLRPQVVVLLQKKVQPSPPLRVTTPNPVLVFRPTNTVSLRLTLANSSQ
jgi:hypothetical protein